MMMATVVAIAIGLDRGAPAPGPGESGTAPVVSEPEAVAAPAGPTSIDPAAVDPVAVDPVAVGPAPVAPTPSSVVGPLSGPEVVVDPTPLSLRPPPPTGDGRGLLIAAGVMGGLNVALAGARLGLGLGESTAEREQTRLILTAVATPIDLVAGVGLAAAGGYRRGRSDGWRTAFDGRPPLRAQAFTASATVLLVMGAVAWASAWTPWHGDPSLDARGGGSLLVESVGSLLLMGGSGLLAYGVSWKKHALLFGRSTRPVALRPALAPGFAGLAVHAKF